MVQGCASNKTKKTESPPSFSQQRFVSQALSYMPRIHPLVKTGDNTIYHVNGDTQNEYRKHPFRPWHVLWRKRKGGCCLRWGDTGALRLSGETSLEEDTAGAGVLGQNKPGWGSFLHSQLMGAWGILINGQVQPSMGYGKTGRTGTHWRSRGNGRARFSPSFCALAHCSLAWGQRDQNIKTDRGEKKLKIKVSVAESCLTLCDPMDCSLPGPSVHGVLQARILEWVAIPFSRKGWERAPTKPAQLERLVGAESKEACSLFEDLELHPEHGWQGGSLKGWSRRVSCVDSSVGVWSGQTQRPDDTGGRGLVMWGWNMLKCKLDTGNTASVPLRPLTFCRW